MCLFIIHTLFIWQQQMKTWFYIDEDSMKKFCANLKEHATEMINSEKRKRCRWQRKRKNHASNKISAKFAKKNLMMMKAIVKFVITAFTQENIVVLQIVSESKIKNTRRNSCWCSIMVFWLWLPFHNQRVGQGIWRTIWVPGKVQQKGTQPFGYQSKKKTKTSR